MANVNASQSNLHLLYSSMTVLLLYECLCSILALACDKHKTAAEEDMFLLWSKHSSCHEIIAGSVSPTTPSGDLVWRPKVGLNMHNETGLWSSSSLTQACCSPCWCSGFLRHRTGSTRCMAPRGPTLHGQAAGPVAYSHKSRVCSTVCKKTQAQKVTVRFNSLVKSSKKKPKTSSVYRCSID